MSRLGCPSSRFHVFAADGNMSFYVPRNSGHPSRIEILHACCPSKELGELPLTCPSLCASTATITVGLKRFSDLQPVSLSLRLLIPNKHKCKETDITILGSFTNGVRDVFQNFFRFRDSAPLSTTHSSDPLRSSCLTLKSLL